MGLEEKTVQGGVGVSPNLPKIVTNPLEPDGSWHVVTQNMDGDGESIGPAYSTYREAEHAMVVAGRAYLNEECRWYPIGIFRTVFIHPAPGGCD